MKSITIPNTKINIKESTSSTIVTTLQSTLLVFLLFFPVTFMHMFLHEAGHALVNLIEGTPVHILYAHPFSFLGFVRPGADYYNVWVHASGEIFELLVSAVIFILLWKRRSFYTLPFLMVFPWSALYNGMGGIFDTLGHTGDYHNIITITGWSPVYFYGISLIYIIVGIFLLMSLFPLLGLKPEDWKHMIAIPAGMLLYSAVGLFIATILVPGSPIDVQYQVAQEIITSARYRPIFMGSVGLLLVMIYGTLYRATYKRLPTILQTEGLCLSWRDLLYPGVLFVISLVLGSMVIL